MKRKDVVQGMGDILPVDAKRVKVDRSPRIRFIWYFIDTASRRLVADMPVVLNPMLYSGVTFHQPTAEVRDKINALVLSVSDKSDQNRKTPLIVEAARVGDLDIISYLVESQAQFRCLDEDGNTPLMLAIQNGHIEVAKELSKLYIRFKHNIKQVNKDGDNILDIAMKKGCMKSVALVLSIYPTLVDLENFEPGSVVHTAIANDSLEIFNIILDNAKPENKLVFLENALVFAMLHKSMYLIDKICKEININGGPDIEVNGRKYNIFSESLKSSVFEGDIALITALVWGAGISDINSVELRLDPGTQDVDLIKHLHNYGLSVKNVIKLLQPTLYNYTFDDKLPALLSHIIIQEASKGNDEAVLSMIEFCAENQRSHGLTKKVDKALRDLHQTSLLHMKTCASNNVFRGQYEEAQKVDVCDSEDSLWSESDEELEESECEPTNYKELVWDPVLDDNDYASLDLYEKCDYEHEVSVDLGGDLDDVVFPETPVKQSPTVANTSSPKSVINLLCDEEFCDYSVSSLQRLQVVDVAIDLQKSPLKVLYSTSINRSSEKESAVIKSPAKIQEKSHAENVFNGANVVSPRKALFC